MTVKGVFFDLYGTLFTYGDMRAELAEWLSEFHACLGKYGLSISEESFVEYYHRRLSKIEVPKPEEGLTLFESRIQFACSDMGVNIPIAGIRQTVTNLLNIWNKYVHLDPYCIPVLDTLSQQHRTLGLISNFDHPPHVWDLIRNSGLDKFLATIIVSGEAGIKKPDPMIFHLALQETELQPHDVLYVGDTEEDIVGTNDTGMISVLIDRSGDGKNYGQTTTITSLRDILSFT